MKNKQSKIDWFLHGNPDWQENHYNGDENYPPVMLLLMVLVVFGLPLLVAVALSH